MNGQDKVAGARSAAHSSAVAVLRPLFEIAQATRPVVLLGAGASFRSGVPLAEEAVKRIAREAFARNIRQTNNTAGIKVGDWSRYLREQSWFIVGAERLAENFPLAVEHLLRPREYRREFFMREMRPINGISAGYRALAKMAQRGLLRNILTTNFDSCAAEALSELGPSIHRYVEINRTKGDISQFSIFGSYPQIVYLHGAAEAYTDRITSEETAGFDEELLREVTPLVRESPVVIIGYRGAEASIMDGFLGRVVESSHAFKRGLYWCHLAAGQPHPNVEALAAKVGPNFFDLTIDGFDELFIDLEAALRAQDVYQETGIQIAVRRTPGAPDEMPVSGVSMDAIDQDLLISVLTTYCKNVDRPVVTRENVNGLLKEQSLAADDSAGLVPSLGGLLLFGKSVQTHFPQACIEVTFGGKKRQIFRGNVVTQYRELVRLLLSKEVNAEIRIKGGRSAQRKPAYNERSIIEMLVNMLVHRDYAVDEPSKIDIVAGDRITFSNPGTLLDDVAAKIRIDADGQFNPVRSVTALRNPTLADIFYGLGSMDKRGSGLSDASLLMREHGGATIFRVDGTKRLFVAQLLQARQDAPGDSETAIALSPYGTYITNNLPLVVLPRKITIAHVGSALRRAEERPRDLLESAAAAQPAFPIHIKQRDRLLSFLSPSTLLATGGNASVVDLEYFVTQPGGRSAVSWLIREHFVQYLRRFIERGFFVELGGHRAYFRLLGEGGSVIRYDTEKRRGIEREVVKRRESQRDAWHENEGIAFDVVTFDGSWAMQIRPFYMFTGPDGATPLPGYRRTRLSTSRMRFDRNEAVKSDLTFWGRFLSAGQPAIQLSTSSEYDLIIEPEFLEIEIPEPELQ